MNEWHDQYGNCCHTLTIAHPVEELLDQGQRPRAHARYQRGGGLRLGRAAAWPLPSPHALYRLLETDSRLRRPVQRNAVDRDVIAALHEIMSAIADDVEYSPGDTHVHTTGAEALEQGSGVCQDHAHIFCAVCRTLGIPARYVSGYLSHGAGHEAHAASHAWADAYVDHLGWVSFDPSNRTCATESHIRTATGLDYAEACPIRGVRSGGGVETMTFSVMFPSQQQQAQSQ